MHSSLHGSSAFRTPQEEILGGLFAETLNVPSVGLDDNFFELGGDSLLAMALIKQAKAVLGPAAHVRKLFEAPTVAGLARALAAPAGRTPAGRTLAEPAKMAVPARTPLSAAQQRLWFLAQLEGTSPRYNMPVAVRVPGPVDATALQAAVRDVVTRHEALRTIFPQADGVPFQHVVEPGDVGDLLRSRTVPAGELTSVLAEVTGEAFDLTTDVPLRVWDLAVLPPGEPQELPEPQEHVLLLLLHHIAIDGWSLRPLFRDLSQAYAARLAGRAPAFPPVPVTYRQYSEWYRTLLEHESGPSGLVTDQLAFWRHALAGLPQRLALPADRPRPAVPSHHGAGVRFTIDAALHARLTTLARRCRATVFMVLQAAVAALLTRSGAGEDIAVCAAVAGRSHDDLDELVGLVANTVVLRADTSGNPSFADLVERVRAADMAAFAHEEVPFDRVVEAANPNASRGWSPLVQVSFGFGPTAIGADELGGFPGAEFCHVETVVAKFEFGVALRELPAPDGTPQGVAGYFEYSTALFDQPTVERLAARYVRLLDQVAADPALSLDRLDLSEQASADPRTDTIVDLFAAQVRRHPDAPALICGSQEITYAELDRRATALARRLIALGVGPETPVAVLLGRSAELVVSLLAVVKAGGAFVPLERRNPPARLAVVMEQSGARVLLADPESLMSVRFDHHAAILVVEPGATASPAAAAPEPPLPRSCRHPDQLAYIMFTSGSTGIPKGVGVTHGDVVALALDRSYAGEAHRRVLVHSSCAFDASTYELWVPLLTGGCCVIAPAGDLDAAAMAGIIAEYRPTAAAMTTSLFNLMVEEAESALGLLREIWTGGEAVSASAIRKLRASQPGTVVVNGYGPTEATTFSTRFFVPAEGELPDNVPIGRPLDGVRIYLLDEQLRPVAQGELGELYVAGAGLARGYAGRPGLTAERFVADPFAGPGARMYRTGDLVRQAESGDLEFAGRTDDQVKIRGFRIEPGEVQAVVQADPLVRLAAVVTGEDVTGGRSLIAYVVPADAAAGVVVADLRERLAARLPDYMVPAAIVPVDALPLTANGKLDRAALPAPERRPDSRGTGQQQSAAPRSAVEDIVCGLFADALGAERVGPQDSFFELGGHSMIAMRLVTRIRSVLGVDFALAQLFAEPTPAGVAQSLAQAAVPGAEAVPLTGGGPRPAQVPLSFAQQRLWFIAQLEGPSATYNMPLVVRLRGTLDSGTLRLALHDLAARHESLRTVFPSADGLPYQQIRPPDQVSLDLPVAAVTERTLDAELRRHAAHVFDVTVDIPLRCWLFEVSSSAGSGPEHDYALLILLHHIAGDGVSLRPLLTDLDHAYQARAAGARPDAEPLAVQYADYTLWQRTVLGGEPGQPGALASQLGYWATALAGMPEQLDLPYDRPRPTVASYHGDTVECVTGPALHQGLVELARRHNCTLFIVLQAAVAAVLSRCGAGPDLPLGTLVSGRPEAALDDLVGFFVNTLVLRVDACGDPTFAELLHRTRDLDLAAFTHQDVPFDLVVERCNPQRSLGRHPLFQVLVALDYGFLNSAEFLLGGQATLRSLSTDTAKFDLSVDFDQRRDSQGASAGLGIVLEYATDLFDRDTVVALSDRLVRLLEAIVADAGQRISEIELLAPAERQRLLLGWNGPDRPEPGRDTPAQIHRIALRRADAVAVSAADGSLTYAELITLAGTVRRELDAAGARIDTVTAVLSERSPWFVATALGVLDSGGGYLAIDPGLPVARAARLLHESGAPVLLTTPALRERAAAIAAACADHQVTVLTPGVPGPVGAQPRKVPRDALAYCVFTSGSTGTPKGVLVTRRGLANHLSVVVDLYGLGERDVMAFNAPLTFDVAIWQALTMLTAGGRVHVLDDDTARDPFAMLDSVARNGVTVLQIVPGVLDALLNACAADPAAAAQVCGLRWMLVHGEEVSSELVRRWFDRFPGVPLANVYGPAECTDDVSIARLRREAAAAMVRPPIGPPLPNTRCYVLDDQLRLAPPGVVGELYVAGAGVARGYARRRADRRALRGQPVRPARRPDVPHG